MNTDVCVTMFNPTEKADICLATLFENRDGVGRIIILDNASSDKAHVESSSAYADVVVTIQKQISLAALWNVGMQIARTRTVVMSNDDIVFTRDWLPPLQQAVEEDLLIGVIQPYNTLAGIPDNFPNNYRREPVVGEIPGDNFIGCCFMVNTWVYTLLKRYDRAHWSDGNQYTYFYEPFHPFGAEDHDFYRRVRNIGFKTVTAFDSYVHHWSGESMKQVPEYEDLKEISNTMYHKRWAGIEP